MGSSPLRATRSRSLRTRATHGAEASRSAGMPISDGELARAALTPEALLALQRVAGNLAVTDGLAWSGPVVQRNNSYEHQLLGDTKPADVVNARQLEPDGSAVWQHLVEEEYSRTTFFKKGADQDPRSVFPDVHWLQLGTSKLWLSAGELAALGDYLPDPTMIDTLDAKRMAPVLQFMRQGIARALYDRLTGGTEGMKPDEAAAADRRRERETKMQGAAEYKGHLPLPEEAAGIEALDEATASLGPNRSKGLMGRNACHFAPFSWERWSLYHNEARSLAKAAYDERTKTLAMRKKQAGLSDTERQAWVNQGYSNHFLQDSFAAGHLINKTQVMQWFVEYNNEHQRFRERPHFGMPSGDVMKGMTTAQQPDIADRRAYTKTRLHTTATQDRSDRSTNVDPQTTLERGDQEGRFAGSGVRSKDPEGTKEFRQYEEFLNNAYLNLSANDIHDWFNARGLQVGNQAGDRFILGGDGTLLLEDESAIGITLKANAMADQAIQDILSGGETTAQVEDIFKLFPSTVTVEGKTYGLEAWNDEIVKAVCWQEIFPKMASKWQYAIVREHEPNLTPGGMLTPKG